MKKTITLLLASGLLLFTMTSGVLDHQGRAGYTGSPNELLCNDCHSSYPLNSGGGSVTIASPTLTNWSYVPGQTYTINVTVAKTGVSLFGIGFEALTSANANAGTLTAGTGTQLGNVTKSGVTRTNIIHTLNGGKGTTNSHVFSFTWKAPATDVGKITFYCAGNATDGMDDEENDYIYTTSQVVTSPSTVGIAEQVSFSKQISIYPNPATDRLQIAGLNSSDVMTVSIMDMKGSLISKKQNVSATDVIELTELNAGSYLLHVEAGGKTAVKQFIKQ
ncbi:MAG TPA: choice-of-anchor V domain-containing protein [Bacteroidia bacterium]|nr:choice-of-anchor V domain-containing protein [Bacteroidia bacterium]